MQKDEMRRAITSRFYQSLAESGVEVNAIPQNQLQAVVNALADGFIAALDSLEEEEIEGRQQSGAFAKPVGTDATEELLWSGRPYLSIGTRYELTNQRLRIIRGLLGRSVEEIELVRVRDTAVSQHMGERALNVGDIEIISNDPSHPTFMLHNVRQANEVRELIRGAVMAERERRGFRYREEM